MTISHPAAYAFSLRMGRLRWNVVGHVVIALLNPALGFLLGILSDGIGVVVAWVFSRALGSGIICLSYHIEHKIPLTELLPRASRVIIVVCLFGIPSAFLISQKFNHLFNTALLNTVMILLFSVILWFPLWLHPMRKRLMGWFIYEFLNKNPIGRKS